MKSFNYTVKDELGIHARPAGMLVKEVKNFESKVTLEKDGRVIDASRLMAVMSMGILLKLSPDNRAGFHLSGLFIFRERV